MNTDRDRIIRAMDDFFRRKKAEKERRKRPPQSGFLFPMDGPETTKYVRKRGTQRRK